MARPALSDEEKKRRGTLDPRWTEDARSARRGEKVVVLFGDNVSVIPAAPVGLNQEAAREYQAWCTALLKAGRLTSLWVEKILIMAIAKHSNISRLAAGKLPRSEDVRAVKSVLSELGGINADTPLTEPGQEGRKFSRFGFAGRIRPPEAS